ncbi:MAG: molybdopterin cofactor-binding domain-containing protein [Gemmatimonadales bacterium]
MAKVKLSRREFVVLGVGTGAGLVLATRLPGSTRRRAAAFQPNPFLRVAPDGTVTIWMARAEMGQGVRTALPMIVADELDADWERVRIIQADAHPAKYGRQMTVGSSSVRSGAWMRLREAGAAAREMLITAAAARWAVPAPECRTEKGLVIHERSGRRAGYGELADAAAQLPVPAQPRLKDPSAFRLIGTRIPQVDLAAKVTGRATFGIDVRLPGMLFATVVRSPVFGGKLKSFDAEPAGRVPGVRDVVAISSGVAVVAEHSWAAFEGARALRIEWEPGEFAMSTADFAAEYSRRIETPGIVAQQDGDAAAALQAAARRHSATYDAPFLSHATMEPMNCTARVRDGQCEVWAPTQNPQGSQAAAARVSGLPIEQVVVHPTYLGCGWGRRSRTEFVEDAVETALKVKAPVQVLWTREEDLGHDYYRPLARCRFEGGLDGAGNLVALSARVVSTPIGGGRADQVDRNGVDGIVGSPYRFAGFRVESHPFVTPVWIGHWRSVGVSQNTFFLESFLDELAALAGKDPVEFRRSLLRDPRARAVLDLAAEQASWGSALPSGVGRGVALVMNKESYVAQVAEASVERGQIRVHRVVCAADCGQVIHPGIVEAQLSGSIISGLGAALFEEITFEGGRVRQRNFADYRLLRFPEAPRVEVHLVSSRAGPGSAGEPGLPPIAPAVANAVFAATGRRLRTLPLTLDS